MAGEDPLLDEIASLLAHPARRDDPVGLERTLTDGYAHVLMLEAERFRLQRRIRQLTATLEHADESARQELSALARRLESSDEDIGRLRGLLARLRSRYSAARPARSPSGHQTAS